MCTPSEMSVLIYLNTRRHIIIIIIIIIMLLFLLLSAGASVQLTTGSRGVRISGSNAGNTMFRGSVKSTGFPLHSPVSAFTSPPSHASPCAITFQLDSNRDWAY